MEVRVASAQNALEHLGLGMQGLMQGKRGLIMGVANDHSIAWGIARTLASQGATLAFTYQGEALGKRVRPLAESLGADLLMTCDVEDIASVDKVFATIGEKWAASISWFMRWPSPTRTNSRAATPIRRGQILCARC